MENYYMISNFFYELRGLLRCHICNKSLKKAQQCRNGHLACYFCAENQGWCMSGGCPEEIREDKCTTLDNVAEIIMLDDVLVGIERILELFQCPICYERITPPVKLCRLGHLVCEACWARITFCPICNSTFMKYENKLMNAIVDHIPYRCFYYTFGCQTYKNHRQIVDHELKCRGSWSKELYANRVFSMLKMFGITFLVAGLTFVIFNRQLVRKKW